MKEKLKPQVKPIYIIPAVIFAFYALSNLYGVFKSARNTVSAIQYGFLHTIPFIYVIIADLLAVVGNGGLAFGIYKNKRNKTTVISYLCITISALMLILYSIYNTHINGIINHVGIKMYISMILTNIISISESFIMLMITASFTNSMAKIKKSVRKLWYLPAILNLLVIILTFAISFAIAHNDNNYIISIPLVVKQMLLCVDNIISTLLLGLWVAYPDGLPKKKSNLEDTY